MANPLFGGQMGQIMQVVNAYQQLRQNPAQIGQFLLDRGKITQDQCNQINQFGGNFGQVGSYLMNQNVMSQNDVSQLSQAVPQVQSVLTK